MDSGELTPSLVSLISAVLIGATVLPAFVLWICSLAVSKYRKDPARVWLVNLRIAFILYVLSCLATITSRTVGMVGGSYYVYERDLILHLSAVSWWLFSIVQILTFLMFIDIAYGIRLVSSPNEMKIVNVVRIGGRVVSAIMLVLTIVSFGLWNTYYANYREMEELGDTSLRLDNAITALFFVLSVATLILAIYTMVKAKNDPLVRIPSTFLLVCSILWLISNVWGVIYLGLYRNMVGAGTYPPIFLPIIFAILTQWLMFIILTIIFSLGVKTINGGLWTVAQTQWPQQLQQWAQYPQQGQPPNPTGYGYGYAAQPAYQNANYAYAGAGWQQQQQQQQQQMHQQYQYNPALTTPTEVSGSPPAGELGGMQRPGEMPQTQSHWEMSSTPSQHYSYPAAQTYQSPTGTPAPQQPHVVEMK